jgi:hypothetical protein
MYLKLDLVKSVFGTSFFAECRDKSACPADSTKDCSPNPAKSVDMEVTFPLGSNVSKVTVDTSFGLNVPGSCALGSIGVHCFADSIPQGFRLTAIVLGKFSPGISQISCLSTTPEKTREDNRAGWVTGPVALPPSDKPPAHAYDEGDHRGRR